MTAGGPTRVLLLSADEPHAEALGGVAVHVAALAAHAPREVEIYSTFPRGGELVVERWGPRGTIATIPVDDSPGAFEHALVAALVGVRAEVLHVHSPRLGPAALAAAARRAGAAMAVTLHDQALVCDNHELLEGGVRFCGIPDDDTRCGRCLATTRGRAALPVREFRARMEPLVQTASAFVAPSESVLELCARVHPGIRARARRIAWGVPEPRVRVRGSADREGPLRVAVVGVWSPVKGRDRVPALLDACSRLRVEWHFFGATDGASRAELGPRRPGVVLHGAYERRALSEELARAGCDLVLLPSVGAEAFSLVLAEVVAAGLPVLASHLGALGERVQQEALGWTFDPWKPEGLAAELDRLACDRGLIHAVAERLRESRVRTEADMVNDHAQLWRELAGARGGPPARDQAALARFDQGVRLARVRRPSWLVAITRVLRRTNWYRDLRLRRLLPEATRRSVESVAARLLGRSPR